MIRRVGAIVLAINCSLVSLSADLKCTDDGGGTTLNGRRVDASQSDFGHPGTHGGQHDRAARRRARDDHNRRGRFALSYDKASRLFRLVGS